MAALAANGYRAIAPDLRGYGDTDVPADPAAYTIFHIVGDLIGLLDHLELPRVSLATLIFLRHIIKHIVCANGSMFAARVYFRHLKNQSNSSKYCLFLV